MMAPMIACMSPRLHPARMQPLRPAVAIAGGTGGAPPRRIG